MYYYLFTIITNLKIVYKILSVNLWSPQCLFLRARVVNFCWLQPEVSDIIIIKWATSVCYLFIYWFKVSACLLCPPHIWWNILI